jgi:DGQHR domain-containing protein
VLPHQKEIEVPLLKTLEELGGKAKPPEIYPTLEKHFPEINDNDRNVTLPSGANKWRNCVAWVRQKLILQGEMASLARGVWSITEKGRERLHSPVTYRASLKGSEDNRQGSTLRFIENLLPASAQSVLRDARTRNKLIGDPGRDFENRVWRLIFGLSPGAITVGRDPAIKLSDRTFRPDVSALFEETRFLLCECKFTTSSAYLSNWLAEFRSVRRELEDLLKKNGYLQFVYVLFVSDKQDIEEHVVTEASNLRVRLVDEREVRYFETLEKQSGIGISHIFWGRVAPSLIRNQELRLPAMRIKGGGKREAFIFSVNAHDLLSRSFVSHRELHSEEEGQIGFQRMLQRKKLNEIASYIQDRDIFPTPIIVAFSKKHPAVFEPLSVSQKASSDMRNTIEFGFLRLPKEVNSIQIIDGQHRLYGYSKLLRSERHIIHVVAYKDEGGNLPTMFVDINSKQTKVPSNLLWELYPDIYGEEDKEYWRAEISRAVEAVSQRSLDGLVEHISSGMHGDISFQTLCTEVKRAKLLEVAGSRSGLESLLDSFFVAIKQLGDQYPGVNEDFVFSNNGIVPLIRTIGRIIRYEVAHNRGANIRKKSMMLDSFLRYFGPVYKWYSSLGTTKLSQMRRRTGNAGFNQAEDEITDAIRGGYLHDFPYRERKTPPEWQAAVDTCTSLVLRINREATDSGKTSGPVFRDFDPDRFKRALSKPVDSEDIFSNILSQLFKEILEGSGKDGPDSRIKTFLPLTSVYQNGSLDTLNVLRTYWEHNRTQVDAAKRQKALRSLGNLCGKATLVAVSELDKVDWQRSATKLVSNLTEQLLNPLMNAIHS